MTRKFTGWHMLFSLIGFFGVVIVVNIFMAVQAERTFGGTVVENSYVASQEFNRCLDAAKAQQALGWKLAASSESGHPAVTAAANGTPLAGAQVQGYAEHPLGAVDDIPLHFREARAGHFVTDTPLPSGRWRLHLRVLRGNDSADFVTDVHA
jgi:nitrogen fixation protein FixH